MKEPTRHLSDELIDQPEDNRKQAGSPSGTTYHYAGISDRVKAAIADLVILGIFMVIAARVFSGMEEVRDSLRVAAFIFIFFLYDPLFTSLFGGTIGHLAHGLRVKRATDETRNILFPLALIRFAGKAALGWLSVITIAGNDKSRAIHDLIAGSVVVFKKR